MRKCKICNIEFKLTTPTKKYCSSDCFNEGRKRRSKKRNNEKAVSRNCKFCKKEYKRVYKKAGFCSISCGSKWNMANGKFEDWRKANLKKKGKEFPCIMCNKLVYKQPRYINEAGKCDTGPLCSRACHKKYMSRLFTGPKNPMFGKKLSKDALKKQKETLKKNYGVENAFFLSNKRKRSKPQKNIAKALQLNFPKLNFKSEKYINVHGKKYFADIFCDKLNLIIEFNGDYWHCNPYKYKKDFFHTKKNMFAQEIWDYDKEKLTNLTNEGYITYIVWEQNYSEDKENVIFKLAKFIRSLNEEKEKDLSTL